MTKTTIDNRQSHETFIASNWMSGIEYWHEQAQKHLGQSTSCPEVVAGTWTAEEGAVFNLANQLKEEISAGSPLQEPSVYSKLMDHALSKVDWQSVAELLLWEVAGDDELTDTFGPLISSCSRAQAIEDGILIDVTEMAKEAGIAHPTALTAAVWAEYVKVPEGVKCQDEKGRLWDILFLFTVASRQRRWSSELRYQLYVRNDNTSPKLVTLKAMCGPGDTPDPVLTILLPDED